MNLLNLPAVSGEINSGMKPEEYKRPLSSINLKHNAASNCSPASDDQNIYRLLKPTYYPLVCLSRQPIKKRTAFMDSNDLRNRKQCRLYFYIMQFSMMRIMTGWMSRKSCCRMWQRFVSGAEEGSGRIK
jgi:hypothetical protein